MGALGSGNGRSGLDGLSEGVDFGFLGCARNDRGGRSE